jgi:hypothetical protein
MDDYWGKPGGGAPKGFNLKKANLDNIVHQPTREVRSEQGI